MNGFDNYQTALRTVINEKEGQIEDFSIEKGRKQAIDDAVSIFDIPSAEKLVEEGVKSSHTRYVLRQILNKFVKEDKVDELMDNIQEKGLGGLLDTDLKGIFKDRANEYLEGDGDVGIVQRFKNLFSTGREKLIDTLKNKPTETLRELKDKVFKDGEERFNALKAERDEKVGELRQKFNEVKERYDGLEDGDEKEALAEQLNSIKAEGTSLKASYKEQLQGLQKDTEDTLKNIQESIAKKSEDLSDSFKDTTQELTSSADESIGNIGEQATTAIREGISNYTPSILRTEEGGDSLIGNARQALEGGFNRFIGMFKGRAEQAVQQVKDTLGDRSEKFLSEFNDRNNFDIPSSLKSQIAGRKQELARIKEQYESGELGEDEARVIQDKMIRLNNEVYDLEGQAEDLKAGLTNTLRENLLSKYGLNEETLARGIENQRLGRLEPDEGDLDVLDVFGDVTTSATRAISSIGEQVTQAPSLIGQQIQFLQDTRGIVGSDSTLARALRASPREHNGTIQAEATREEEETAQSPEPTTQSPEQHEQQEQVREGEAQQPEGQAVNDVVPESERELAETGEKVGESVAKKAGEGLGEEIAEGVGEATAEAGVAEASTSYLGPLALIVGLGTLIGQTIHNIHEAKEQAHIKTLNPSAQMGV